MAGRYGAKADRPDDIGVNRARGLWPCASSLLGPKYFSRPRAPAGTGAQHNNMSVQTTKPKLNCPFVVAVHLLRKGINIISNLEFLKWCFVEDRGSSSCIRLFYMRVFNTIPSLFSRRATTAPLDQRDVSVEQSVKIG